jgi:hypothetical protein
MNSKDAKGFKMVPTESQNVWKSKAPPVHKEIQTNNIFETLMKNREDPNRSKQKDEEK